MIILIVIAIVVAIVIGIFCGGIRHGFIGQKGFYDVVKDANVVLELDKILCAAFEVCAQLGEALNRTRDDLLQPSENAAASTTTSSTYTFLSQHGYFGAKRSGCKTGLVGDMGCLLSKHVSQLRQGIGRGKSARKSALTFTTPSTATAIFQYSV